MKNKTKYLVRILCVFTLYICCSSVVCCCEASKPAAMRSSLKKQESKRSYDKNAVDEDLSPLQLISVHITSLM